MTDSLVQALREWQNFYFMIGTASATLVGLMFVAVSLGADLPHASDESSVSTFVTPMLVHFGSVLVIAAIMLVPTLRQISLGIALLVTGLLFTLYSGRVSLQFIRHPGSAGYNRTDWKWYVIFPVLGDLLIVLVALLILLSGSIDALNLLAVASVILLLDSVRNTWDLMLWIARSRLTHNKE